MNKNTLLSFVDKYSLNGSVESVKWTVSKNENKIKTSSITDDKSVLAFVTIKDSAGLEDAEFGVNDTSKLKKMSTVLDDEVNISLDYYNSKITSVTLRDTKSEVQYVTSDISVIPVVPNLKKLPTFNLEIPLTKEFVSAFVKAKGALSDINNFTILKDKKDKLKLVIGYSNTNCNRISLDLKPIEGKDTIAAPIHFSAKYLKEILTSNSDCENSVLKISDGGLAEVNFENEKFSSDYYLLAIKNID